MIWLYAAGSLYVDQREGTTMKTTRLGFSEPVLPPYEMISLESLGAFMLFGGIDQKASYATCEFIIKENLLSMDDDPITLFINSEGGSVPDGFAIIDTMETSRVPVQTVGMGLIASMGLLIFAAGQKGSRTLCNGTEIMAHQFWAAMEGKQHELIAMSIAHMRTEQQFIKHYLKHSNMTEKQIKDVLFSPTDRYLTPQECLKYGLCDHIANPDDFPRAKRAGKPASRR
jgi:ATP-dependent Clp protease protease subunit